MLLLHTSQLLLRSSCTWRYEEKKAHRAFVLRAEHSLSMPGHILLPWLRSSLSPQSHDSSSWKSSYVGMKGPKSKRIIA